MEGIKIFHYSNDDWHADARDEDDGRENVRCNYHTKLSYEMKCRAMLPALVCEMIITIMIITIMIITIMIMTIVVTLTMVTSSPVLKSSAVEFDNYQNTFVRHFASQSIVT